MRFKPKGKFVWAVSVGLLTAGLWQLWAQQAPARNPNFTGGEVTPVTPLPQASIVSFKFAPGARTKWHSHSNGQIIMAEEGVARVQVKGGPLYELKAGEVIYMKPGEVHWHGSSPTEAGVQYNITRGDITWLQEVTDAEFSAKAKSLR
jgi:quercetin dioxygenase-like cupin family protein